MSEIKALQKKIGVKTDGEFGPKTTLAFAKFYGFSNAECAHFLGQCDHETGGWKRFEENLNYSWSRILEVFPKYVKTEAEARSLQFNPVKLAEVVYGGRMGNKLGSGDGFKFRGRSAIHLTGRENYERAENDLGYPLTVNPDLAKNLYCFEVAFWFFVRNRIWSYCKTIDQTSVLAVSRAINLGSVNAKGMPNHFEKRLELVKKYYTWLDGK